MIAALEIAKPRCLANLGAVLGEGPLCDPRDGALYSLDIKGGKLFRTDLVTEESHAIPAPGMVSALGLAQSGGLICAMGAGFAHLTIANNKASFTSIADPEKHLPGNRFNDGKVDPAGGFWAGTMDNSEAATTGAWWRLALDGAVTKIDDGYRVTNGPAFDAARARVFLTDSARQTVFVAQTDGAAISEKRVFLQFGDGDGYPDGMEVDADGCLWIAFWDGWSVRRYSPDGDLLAEARLPVPRPTSIALAAGKLFVTSASIGLDEKAIDDAPLSGGLFCFDLSRNIDSPVRYFDDAELE